MRHREVRIILALAALAGLATLYFGETGSCLCTAQSAGQPAPFNEFQAEVVGGLAVIVASVIGLALSSFHARKNAAQAGTVAGDA